MMREYPHNRALESCQTEIAKKGEKRGDSSPYLLTSRADAELIAPIQETRRCFFACP
jgi:hypothetical protein